MLITKKVFNFTPVEDEDLKEMLESCLQHLGIALYDAEMERDKQCQDTCKDTWAAETMLLFFDKGQQKTFNTNCIMFEEDIPLTDIYITKIASYYMEKELGQINTSRYPEYKKFIQKLLQSQSPINKLQFKIIQIGNHSYYCYSL